MTVCVGVWKEEMEIRCSAVGGRDIKERGGHNSGIVGKLLVRITG